MHIQTYIVIHTYRYIHTETQTGRQTDTYIHTYTLTEAYRERHTDKGTSQATPDQARPGQTRRPIHTERQADAAAYIQIDGQTELLTD